MDRVDIVTITLSIAFLIGVVGYTCVVAIL